MPTPPFVTRIFKDVGIVAAMAGGTVMGTTNLGVDTRFVLGQPNGIPLLDAAGNIKSGAPGRLLKVTFLTVAGAGVFLTGPITTAIYAELVGGSGAGGGAVAAAANAAIGGGGQAGSYAAKLMVVTPATNYNYVVGAGGAGVAGAQGNTGVTTSFATGTAIEIDAFAGKGGPTLASGVALGFVDGGWQPGGGGGAFDVNLIGEGGGIGTRLSGTVAASGRGGNSTYGAGGRGLIAAGAGLAGDLGGGGGALSFSASSFAGGAGSAGMIILREYA
jgi:hypothetical protein